MTQGATGAATGTSSGSSTGGATGGATVPLRIGILGAARIAELSIVKPAAATGHRLVAVAARRASVPAAPVSTRPWPSSW